MNASTSVSSEHEALFKKFIIGFTIAFIVIGGPLLMKPLKKLKGKGLNSNAWRSSYRERHLFIPPGPREGWWGIHWAPIQDPVLGLVYTPRHDPGMFDVDARGMQHSGEQRHPQVRLLILGGSVAAGAYASNLYRTYFYQLGDRLNQRSRSVAVDVLATGSWTSENELAALKDRGLATKPDYILFLDGLNDVMLFDKLPEEERVRDYLQRLREARDLALAHGIKVIFAPQPFLPDKKKSGLEVMILYESYPHTDRLINAYNQLRAGLQAMTIPGRVYYIDTSPAFSPYARTIFADIWHFSDVGHALLADYRAFPLASAGEKITF